MNKYILNADEYQQIYDFVKEKEGEKYAETFMHNLLYDLGYDMKGVPQGYYHSSHIQPYQVKEMIEKLDWSQLQPFEVLPIESMHSRTTEAFGLSSKKSVNLFEGFFRSKQISIFNEIQHYILEENKIDKDSNDFVEHTKTYFHYLDMYSKSFSQEQLKIFEQTMEQLTIYNNRESEALKIKGLKKAFEKNIDKNISIQWFASLVISHNTIAQKNIEGFNEIKGFFSEEELKAVLPKKEFNKLYSQDSDIFHSREVVASLYDLNVIELKMKTKGSAINLKYNLKNFFTIVENYLKENKDFIGLNVKEKKQEFSIELLYDNNVHINEIKTKQVFETLLSSVIELKEDIKVEELIERCNKIKSAYLLDEKLSKKDNTKTIKPKI